MCSTQKTVQLLTIAVALVMHGTQQGIVGQKTCDDCRSASSARLLTMCTSLNAKNKDEQDEPLRAKNNCAVDENDCDLQVATSRRPAFERAQRGMVPFANSVVVADRGPRAEIFYQGSWLQG